jgi:hypothetical protein
MADINFGILDTQMPGRIAAIPQQQQAQQAQNAMQLMQVQQTMQQNALAKAKMDEYTRGLNEKNTLNQIYNQYYGGQGVSPAGSVAGDASVNGLISPPGMPAGAPGIPSAELARRGLGHMIPAFEEQQLKITKERGAILAQQAKADADRTTAAANKTKALGTGLLSVKDNPTDEALISAFDRMDSTGIDTKPFRAEFAKVTDLNERKKIINNYALTNPEARAALSFVTPHPIQVQRGDKIIFIDDNSHSPTYGKEVLPPQTMGMTPYQTGQLRVSEGNLAATRARLTDEGIPFGGAPAAVGAPVAAPVNAMAALPTAPVNAMIPRPATPAVAPTVAPRAMPTSSNLSAAAARRVAEEQAKAQIPKFDRDAGGFITPPTPGNPNGTFVPLTAMQNNKDVQANVKALKMAGYDPTTGKDEISDLIGQSTGGVIQSAAAGTLGALNITTSGADAIARLSTRVKAMTLSLLNGKLGAGISNADRDFIEGQFGDIANPNIASGKRLAAWDEAKKRMLSLGMLAMPDQPQTPAAAATTPTGAPAKPSAAVAPALTPADQQALDWASANPKDPRATQIKKRLGRD